MSHGVMTGDRSADFEGKKPVEVLLVDDQALLVEAIVTQLGNDSRLKIIAAAGSATEAEKMIDRLDADVALIDMMLPDEPGEHLIGLLAQRSPRTLCIALSADESDEMLLRAIQAGAAGFLAKGTGTLDGLINSVLSVIDGRLVFPPGRLRNLLPALSRQAAGGPLGLDDDDRRLVGLIADQADQANLAAEFATDQAGVQARVVELITRLEVNSPLQAVMAAARHGQVP